MADVTVYNSDADMLYIFSVLNRNSQINRFRIAWGWRMGDHATKWVVTYNCKTKTLWSREKNFTYASRPQSKVYIYKGVSGQMLYNAAVKSFNNNEGNVFSSLNKQGCQLILFRQSVDPWLVSVHQILSPLVTH